MRGRIRWWLYACFFVIAALGMALVVAVAAKVSYQLEVRIYDLAQGELIEAQAEYIGLLERALEAKWTRNATITAYTARVEECDADPGHTASMTKPRPGIVAVSRDLFREGWTFGKRVYLYGLGVYEIADLMNERHEGRIDVFMDDLHAAKAFGVKEAMAVLIEG